MRDPKTATNTSEKRKGPPCLEGMGANRFLRWWLLTPPPFLSLPKISFSPPPGALRLMKPGRYEPSHDDLGRRGGLGFITYLLSGMIGLVRMERWTRKCSVRTREENEAVVFNCIFMIRYLNVV